MTCRASGAIAGTVLLMIWYLLSPIRGTTQPPRLSAGHPIRRAFYRHGKTTAQHWLITMLVSVAVAMGFSYPTVFLSDPTAGLAASPHHVWTLAKPIDTETHIDIEMRQIWVHGSYMDALNKNVLRQALAVQQSLNSKENLDTNASSWIHSPLALWNNSIDAIEADDDLLKTINRQKSSTSSLNVQLRPASVFAGKKFARHELIAADALVITLLNRGDTRTGQEWQDRMQELTHGVCDNCNLFPADGLVTSQRVFEFSFTPVSVKEHVALTFAYTAMALYVLLSLRRMKAFHSRFGLVVTAITQMTCSILASFTICGLLKINLSMIPSNAYPFVVLVLGVENMFRLINAVLAYPSTMATEVRIANALGDIGPLSVAAAAQNLMILFLLSTVVSPGVAAFCAFAALATLFDAFFLLTFFVAVLNVDIRRLELQDSIRHNTTKGNRPGQNRHRSPAHHTWFDALIQGRLPFSTRMAGTAVTTTFILSLNYHFFEHKESSTTLRHVLGFANWTSPSVSDMDMFTFPPMNATLTPVEWLHMQDFDTAKEVMRLAKPGADSFVIRLFAPLVIVLDGSDRTDTASEGTEWTQALRSFTLHHFYPVAVAVVFAVAFVAVLMNFLLYNEAGDEENDVVLEELEESLTSQSILLPHKLDIVKMASNENGHCVTIALDRTVAVTSFDTMRQTHSVLAVSTNAVQEIVWPIHHLAIDPDGEWIAYHCANDSIGAYNTATGATILNLVQYPDDHPAIIFAFVNLTFAADSKLHFVVLTSAGRLAMTCMMDGKSIGADVSTVSLVGASFIETTLHGRQILTATEQGECISHTLTNGGCTQANPQVLRLRNGNGRLGAKVNIQQQKATNIVAVTTGQAAVFLSGIDLTQITRLELEVPDCRIQRVLLGSARMCATCGGFAVRRLAFMTIATAQNDSVLHTWSPGDEIDAEICLSSRQTSCKAWSQAKHEQHSLGQAGIWCGVGSQVVLGLRKRIQSHQDETLTMRERRPTKEQLRRRRRERQSAQESDEQWEAYKLLPDGSLETSEPLCTETGLDTLYVSSAGPAVVLDSQSVAVAFGNTVKILQSKRIPGGRASSRRESGSARRIHLQ